MPYQEIEESSHSGSPVELYTFSRGVQEWRYTSFSEDITFNNKNYTAAPIERGKIEATPDLGKVNLKIQTVRTLDFLTQYIASSPSDVINLVVTRFHLGDTDSTTPWRGRVTNVRFEEVEATITCQPIYTAVKRPGLRRVYQSSCPHVLYNSPCNIIQTNYTTSAQVSAVGGNTITSPSFIINNANFGPEWFTGGMVLFTGNGVNDRRFITDHNNSTGTITVSLPFTDLTVGDTVSAFPGCDHTTVTCKGKFNNLNNYGGFPYIPDKNPMDGTPIF